jgi:hypothetical protein
MSEEEGDSSTKNFHSPLNYSFTRKMAKKQQYSRPGLCPQSKIWFELLSYRVDSNQIKYKKISIVFTYW